MTNKQMLIKRITICIALALVLLIPLSVCGAAEDEGKPDAADCIPSTASADADDVERVQKMLAARGVLTKDYKVELLYNEYGRAEYLLVVTKRNYYIVERRDCRFCEKSSGNPYADYMECQKYYSGPLGHFVKLDKTALNDKSLAKTPYYNITMRQYSKRIAPLFGISTSYIREWLPIAAPVVLLLAMLIAMLISINIGKKHKRQHVAAVEITDPSVFRYDLRSK